MKPTTDGRWAHLACAMWIPGCYSCFSVFFFFFLHNNFRSFNVFFFLETCLSDIKKMEPIDGLNRISKVVPSFSNNRFIIC